MADEKASENENSKGAPAADEAASSVPVLKVDIPPVRAEAHKAGTEAVERALSVPA